MRKTCWGPTYRAGHFWQVAKSFQIPRCKARHVLRSFRDGAPEARREADRMRDSACAGYGTGNVREATGSV